MPTTQSQGLVLILPPACLSAVCVVLQFIRKLMPFDSSTCDLVTQRPRNPVSPDKPLSASAAFAPDAAAPVLRSLNATGSGAALASAAAAASGGGGGGAALASPHRRVAMGQSQYGGATLTLSGGESGVAVPHRPRALSISAERELALVLKRAVELEREVDRVRARLCGARGFNLHSALQALDRDGSGQIGVAAFRQFLTERGVVASEAELSALLARYDKAGRGRIRYGAGTPLLHVCVRTAD
jgi:hypothetical protein